MSTLLSGHTVDQNRHPVANARVSINKQLLAETSRDGSFSANIAAPDPRLAVTASARGSLRTRECSTEKLRGAETPSFSGHKPRPLDSIQ